MKTVKFLVYSKWKEIVTGGHKYDNDLFKIIDSLSNYEVKEVEIGCHDHTSKLLKPFKELMNGIKAGKADLIIFNSSKCLRFMGVMIWLKLFRRQQVYSIHHHFIHLEFKGIKKQIYKLAENMFLRLSDKIIIPSPYIYSILQKKRKPEDLLLWRIPFETRQEYKPTPIIGNLTFAGTIEPRKGLIYLMKSLKILQENNIDYRLKILGKVIDNNYYGQLEKFIAENNLNVEFMGFVSKDEKNRILSETDIFVFPSLLEGFGMVLVEAQVYALPIVCFNNSSMPFSVKENENGFLVPTGAYKDMAAKIKVIITDRELRLRLSDGALENVRNQNTFKKFEETVIDFFKYKFTD